MTLADCTPEYVAWLNDEDTTRYLGTHEATLASQRQWIADRLGNVRASLYVIEADDRMVGSLKLEWDGDRVVTLALMIGDPASRGRGIGTQAIRLGVAKALALWPEARQIAAGVHPANMASIQAFEKAGFGRADWRPEQGWMRFSI